MPRRALSLSLFFAAAALTGCQDYNFNPVPRCAIQPGAKRSDVSKIGTADVLFVVDDSMSMTPEQARLVANFDKFIGTLAEVQKERKQAKLDPFEFHIAVTTTSIFEAWQVSTGTTPLCGGSPTLQCVIPAPQTRYFGTAPDTSTCSGGGQTCNDLITNYAFHVASDPPGTYFLCAGDPGIATGHNPFPSGDFVARGDNPRVLHFTKDLDWTSWVSPWEGATGYDVGQLVTSGGNTYQCAVKGTSAMSGGPTGTSADITDGSVHWKYVSATSIDPNLTALVQGFKQNIFVGVCGSGMEQPFEASRLALKKALRQDGYQQPVAQSEFMHSNSKLVVVFVGDEDDCSNPNDATRSLAFTLDTSNPGSDVCVTDETKPLDQQTLLHVKDYADFLTGLGRPLAAAFVYSAQLQSCRPDANGNIVCTPGACQCQCPTHCSVCDENQSGDCKMPASTDPNPCTGKMPTADSRYHELSAELRSRTAGGSRVNTYESSVCEADWANTLQEIAKLVVPPSGLTLPSIPADKDVVALSIQDGDGNTRSYCTGPQIPVSGQTWQPTEDWWFVNCDNQSPSPVATTCIKLNTKLSAQCQPNPGESYVAFYLGRVGPDSGCSSDQDCNEFFKDMTGGSFTCANPGTSQSTCVCKAAQ